MDLEYRDIGMIKLINDYKLKQYGSAEDNDITNGYAVIGEEKTDFVRQETAGNEVSILVPRSYGELSHMLKKVFLDSNKVPDYMYTDEKKETALFINIIRDGNLTGEAKEEIRDRAKEYLSDSILRRDFFIEKS